MFRRNYRLLAIFLGLLAFSSGYTQLSDEERAIKAEELARLQGRIESIVAERNEVRSRYDEVQQALRTTERKVGAYIQELKQIKQQLRKQDRQLQKLFKQQKQLQRDVKNQRELLGEQIRAAYMIGRQEYLKLLLNQQDPAAMGRTMAYYKYFNQARQARIEQALQSITQLDAVSRRLEQEKRVLQAMRDEQKAKKQALEKTNRQRAQLVAQLSQEIHSKEEQIKQLRQNEQQLKAVLEAIEDTLADILPAEQPRNFAAYKGRLIWPANGKVDNLYGQSRHKGRLKWNGVMIHAREGNTVHAVSRGRVAYADWLRGYGLLVILDHGDGYMSLYGHNQSLLKEVG
ncbi:MAG: peptidoglycan DD-metalloendopeptidase family protein, partial [Gammaproteobacteria bacterium]|nr:peptidoglycan DD-metalloendopeptidase family protein [Gammaproteobacteria bacterium]